jgi:uncharacterized protein
MRRHRFFSRRKAFMTPQEKDLLTTLLARLKSAGGQAKDPEADALIRQATAEQPDMPYYLTQTVLIQDLSLHNAQSRITDLEKQLAEAQQAAKPSAGSFLGGLFGHRPSAPAADAPQAGPWTRSPQVAGAPPAQPYGQPGYAQPGYGQPMGGPGGMMGAMGGGGGFLRSAAATAAGVAGGALLFQGISSLFGNHYAGGLMGAGMTPGLGETVINNYYGSDAGGGDWSSDPGGTGGGGDYSSAGFDPGGGDYSSQDYSSDQDFGGGGDWSSGSDNTSC